MGIRPLMQFHNLPARHIRWESAKRKPKMSKPNSLFSLNIFLWHVDKQAFHLKWFLRIKRYFDDDDEANTPDLAYIPAPGSPSADEVKVRMKSILFVAPRSVFFGVVSAQEKSNALESSDEEDPLDAFMMGLEKTMEKEKTKGPADVAKATSVKPKGTRGDIDDEDDEESYYR